MNACFALAAGLLSFASLALGREIVGRVVGVRDGDSITVLTDDSRELKVRLEGIDAPELKLAFGNVSKQELSRLVFGKSVRLEEKGKDRYGRTLAHV
jgi:micrococcal nuclease